MQMDRTDEISDGSKVGFGLTHEPDDQLGNSLIIFNDDFGAPSQK